MRINILFFILFSCFAVIFNFDAEWKTNYFWCIYLFYAFMGLNIALHIEELKIGFFYLNFLFSAALSGELTRQIDAKYVWIGMFIFTNIAWLGFFVKKMKK